MRRFRSWLVWLVVAVMPLQGLAAAVMPMTAGTTHAGPVASALAGQGAAVAGHEHRQDHGSAVVDHHVGAQGDACDGCTDGAAAHGPLSCCGAACTMALGMTASLPFGSQARPPAPHAVPTGLHPGVVPDGLDRPPRTS